MRARIILATLLATAILGIPANARSVKKITPVLGIGAGLSLETDFDNVKFVEGLATELDFGLDILLKDKWSIMPQIGHNFILGDAWYILLGAVGGDADFFSFYNASILGRYWLEDGLAIGFGPAIYITKGHPTYYIDADPSDPRNDLIKIKPWDYGIRATLTKDCGKHWRIGALANIGLRDMMYQYPDFGIRGHANFFSLCLTVGFRF